MPVVRPIRLTALVKGTSTTIVGAVSAGWRTNGSPTFSRSDGALGPTGVDISAWSITGFVEVDDIEQAAALSFSTAEALKIDYQRDGGTTRRRTFDTVRFGSVQNMSLPAAGGGTVTRFRVSFEVVWAATDALPSDVMAVATV